MANEKAAPAPVTATTEAEELPRTIVRRVVKEKLSEVSGDGGGGGDVNLHKEALIAFSESARIFIHYLSATAHDICNESKRQIINAEDVLKALEEIEFSEFVEPLRAALDEFRKKAAGKRASSAKAKEANKKKKTDKETATENGRDEGSKEDDEGNADGDEEQGSENNDDQATEDNEDDDDQATEDNGDQATEDGDQASEDNDDSHDSRV